MGRKRGFLSSEPSRHDPRTGESLNIRWFWTCRYGLYPWAGHSATRTIRPARAALDTTKEADNA